MSYDDYVKQRADKYKNSLRNHKLLSSIETPNVSMWIIGEPDSSHYLTSIIAIQHGALIVTGDVSVVQFMYSHYPPSVSRVKWIATSNISYVAEKAQIGMDALDLVWRFDPAIALADAKEMLREATENVSEDEDMWKRAVELLEQGDYLLGVSKRVEGSKCIEKATDLIYQEPDFLNFGQVPTDRVILAWVLCQKAYELISEGP